MWDVIQHRRGKDKIVFTGELSKARSYMNKIRSSQNKGIGRNNDRVEYRLEKTTKTIKYKEKPHNWGS